MLYNLTFFILNLVTVIFQLSMIDKIPDLIYPLIINSICLIIFGIGLILKIHEHFET
jgi:hypothetical protein